MARNIAILLILIGVVILFAGSGQRGLRAAGSIVVVIVGLIVLMAILGWIIVQVAQP